MTMDVSPPEPALTDGVVTVRPWGEKGDAETIVAACNDRAIAEFLDAIPQPYTRSDAEAYLDMCRVGWLDGTMTNFAIVVEGMVVGSIGVRWIHPDQGVAEVGYWVAPEARGKRVCTRALELVSSWVLAQQGMARLQLRADEENVASNRVAQNAGYTREGVLRASRYNSRLDRRVNFVMYSLLRDELPQSKAASTH
jgi:RimJ/RimL family protein N-acetyltransferase